MDKEMLLHQYAEMASLMIWERRAFLTNVKQPFKLASGLYSPIYINCRRLISSPSFLSLLSAATREMIIERDIGFDVIAGGETAGIPFAFSLARDLDYPAVYVRKASKGHGVAGKVEGVFEKGDSFLLVEDLITTAGSKLDFIKSIKEVGGCVDDVLVVFDREQGGEDELLKHGVRLHSLTTLSLTLNIGIEEKILTEKGEKIILDYLNDPVKWNNDRGYLVEKD